MRRYSLLALFLFTVALLNAQQKSLSAINQFADITGAIGQSQGTVAASYVYNWRIGKKRKWEAGLGLRYTSFFGVKKDFTTAPARLARSTTTPFVIVFAAQKTA